ncbi:hypothetical protein BB560_004583 [Smittium megazygosporum]|uniref:HMG box domain-containing protein n=1 Tax=Smittium megazygosporum TaxID=133381 RepID=A0A2T9Z8T5_9FUNG|nr:hypothetical protein BB560_004583 [Smittium megazygosporum]
MAKLLERLEKVKSVLKNSDKSLGKLDARGNVERRTSPTVAKVSKGKELKEIEKMRLDIKDLEKEIIGSYKILLKKRKGLETKEKQAGIKVNSMGVNKGIRKIEQEIIEKEDRSKINVTRNVIEREQIEKKLNSRLRLITPPKMKQAASRNIFIKESFQNRQALDGSNNLRDANLLMRANDLWKNLRAEEKAKYKKKADELNAERMDLLKEWWDNADEKLIKLENKRVQRINIKNKQENKPLEKKLKNPFLKPTINSNGVNSSRKSVYAEFTKDMYAKKVVCGGVINNYKQLSQLWHNLSKEEKDQYRIKIATK